MNQLLAFFGLKWNPFSQDIPPEALYVSPRVEHFCGRVEQQAREGGFALVVGEPGMGKSTVLRLLFHRLAGIADLITGSITGDRTGLWCASFSPQSLGGIQGSA
jgi:general secretion pathway protein A